MKVLLMPVAVTQAPLYLALAHALRDLGHEADLLPIFPRTKSFLARRGIPTLDFAGPYRSLYRSADAVPSAELAELADFELRIARAEVRPRLARACAAVSAFFGTLQSRRGYQRVVLNNGSGFLCGAAKRELRARGVELAWHTEAGFLPNTLVLDPHGVNRRGALMDLATESLPEPAPDTASYLVALLAGRVRPRPWASALDSWTSHVDSLAMLRQEMAAINGRTSWQIARQFLVPKLAARLEPGDRVEPRELGRYVFVPLQVHDDTQVLVNSDRIRDMEALVSAVARALPADLRLVVKPHPMDRGRSRSSGVRRALAALGSRATLVRHAPSMELVRHAQCVVTLNSTVGFEGLLHGRPVATLGAAWYAKRGLATPIADPTDLSAWLRDPRPPEPHEVLRWLSFLRHHYLLPGGFRDVTPVEARGIAARIVAPAAPPSAVAAAHA
ncbi:MAG: hypothetical protein U0610_05480 [bacterium]